MKLSKASAQASLALAYLADQEADEPIQARHVAAHLGIPTDSALKILQGLARGGLILSTLGRGGGYRLDRRPEELSLLQIVEVIDGPISGQMRIERAPRKLLGSVELLQSVCDQAASNLRKELARITVADLTKCNRAQILAPTG